MDERREECEELAALDREATDAEREARAAELANALFFPDTRAWLQGEREKP